MSNNNNNFNKDLNLLAEQVNINAVLGQKNLNKSNNKAANNKAANNSKTMKNHTEPLLTGYNPDRNSIPTWIESNRSNHSDVLPGLNYNTLMSQSQHSTLPDNLIELDINIYHLTQSISYLYHYRYGYPIQHYNHYKNLYIQKYNSLINDFNIITDETKYVLTPALNKLQYHLRLMKSFGTTSHTTGRVAIAPAPPKKNNKTKYFKPIKKQKINKTKTKTKTKTKNKTKNNNNKSKKNNNNNKPTKPTKPNNYKRLELRF